MTQEQIPAAADDFALMNSGSNSLSSYIRFQNNVISNCYVILPVLHNRSKKLEFLKTDLNMAEFVSRRFRGYFLCHSFEDSQGIHPLWP